jgi:hypothetical protein
VKVMNNIWENVISVITSLAAVAAAIAAWKAASASEKSVRAMNKQIDNEEKRRYEEQREQTDYLNSAVIKFLLPEIEYNLNVVGLMDTKEVGKIHKLKFDEFEKAKYLLIKNPTDIVEEVIKLYDMFSDIMIISTETSDPKRIKIINKIMEQWSKIQKILESLRVLINLKEKYHC